MSTLPTHYNPSRPCPRACGIPTSKVPLSTPGPPSRPADSGWLLGLQAWVDMRSCSMWLAWVRHWHAESSSQQDLSTFKVILERLVPLTGPTTLLRHVRTTALSGCGDPTLRHTDDASVSRRMPGGTGHGARQKNHELASKSYHSPSFVIFIYISRSYKYSHSSIAKTNRSLKRTAPMSSYPEWNIVSFFFDLKVYIHHAS
jgi:hypothetical protein